MLVRVGPTEVRRADDPSGAGKRIIERFEHSEGTPGLLLVGAQAPHQMHGHRSIDGLVITPNGITAIEAAELLQRQHGTLRCSMDSVWTVDGQPALLRAKQANPASELETNIYALSNALEEHGIATGPIGGLVIVLPEHPGELHLSGGGKLRRGMHVVLAEQLDDGRELRKHLQRGGRRKEHWSADDVLAACAALDAQDYAPSRHELLLEGFAGKPSARGPERAVGTTRQPALRTPRAAVPTATAPEPPLGETAVEDPPTPPRGLSLETEEHEEAPHVFEHRPTVNTRRLRGLVPAVVALVAAVLLGLVLVQWMQQIFH